MSDEVATSFSCGGSTIPGILHLPGKSSARGLVIVVGGPQTRVGSHRQFVLLARALAHAGIPVLRFDYRGMGDAGGAPIDFTGIRDDIAAAVDHLNASVPGVRDVVLWGLCDAASAILFYAHQDPRVTGIVLANPWARTEQGIARAYLKNYYFRRILDANFWRKFMRGEFAARASFASLGSMLRNAIGGGSRTETKSGDPIESVGFPLRERMLDGMRRFRGRVLLILSGDDLTAGEFKDMVEGSRQWRRQIASPKIVRRDFPEANHTFSRAVWRDQVADWTIDWMSTL